MKISIAVAVVAIAAAILFATTQLALFVVQPIGTMPEGLTLVIWRANTMKFIDSSDAWCERQTKDVSDLCRSLVLAKIEVEDVIIATLPYSETLYLRSTGGRTY